MSAVTHPRIAPTRSARVHAWWAKAWQRAVEESSYHAKDLKAGQRLARAGAVGGVTVDRGSLVAAVQEGDDAWTVTLDIPVLHQEAVDSFVELVAAESGRLPDLLAGELPHLLVEQAEDSGVELLPYGGELGTTCSCGHWAQPCHHALAVLTQFGWLIEEDPLGLVLLRGLPRRDLMAALHARTLAGRTAASDVDPSVEDDVSVAVDAAVRAARILEVLGSEDPDVDHLF